MGTKLLDVNPKDLKFTFELKKQSCCTVRLTNITDNDVAFKVKTTSPNKYCVRPNVGVVPPHTTTKFTITMQAPKIAPAELMCKDKFLVQSTVVSPGTKEQAITTSIFSKNSGKYVEEVKLKVTLISPPLSPLTESEDADDHKSSKVNVCVDEEPFVYEKPNGVAGVDNVTSLKKSSEVEDVYTRSRNNSIEVAAVDIKTWDMPIEEADVDIKAREIPVEVADCKAGKEHNESPDVDTKKLNDSAGVEYAEMKSGMLESAGVDTTQGMLESADVDMTQGMLASAGVDTTQGMLESADVDMTQGMLAYAGVDMTHGMLKSDVDMTHGMLESAGVDMTHGMLESDVDMTHGMLESADVDIEEAENASSFSGLQREEPFRNEVRKMKRQLHSLESKLEMAVRNIGKLSEERRMSIEEGKALREQVEMLKRTHRKEGHSGFPLLFVVVVAIMSTILGYLSHH